MDKNIEIRKLPANALCNIINILETNNDWKKVMSVISKDPNSLQFEPKYNGEHIRLIEKHAEKTKQPCTEILFNEWGTSGRLRPTLTTLKNILIKVQIFRAADEIAAMLGEETPQRPSYGPAAAIATTELFTDSNTNEISCLQSIENEICNGTTKQIKSDSVIVSDMMVFSDKTIEPSIVKHSINNKTTIQMKSEDNLIEFSYDHSSMNIPNITEMLKSHQSKNIDITVSTSESISNITESNKSSHYISESSSYHADVPAIYQTTFPNIDISQNIESSILQNTNLIQFKYDELNIITNNFSHTTSNSPSGMSGKIGSGGFGDVFVGTHATYGLLAVKKLHNHLLMHQKPEIAMRVFNAEVKHLAQFKHINIVPILGFSIDGPAPCIVCEYIEGGSLQNNIAARKLNEKQRIDIMVGTAEGLKYLHTSDNSVQSDDALLAEFDETSFQNSTKHFLHGDVKSANILLTSDCVPKLCDFGLTKQCDGTFVTTSPMGTSAYMAPEGIHGTITQKNDIFSFGIVLLELLTGLRPIVMSNGEKLNIKDYVEENLNDGDITGLLDPIVKNLTKAKEIYKLVQNCLERNRKSRPTIVEVCDRLYKVRND